MPGVGFLCLLATFTLANGAPKHVPIEFGHFARDLFGIEPSTKTGALVAKWDPETSPGNPEELGNLAEGDIRLPPVVTNGRNGIFPVSFRWSRGVVPYEIVGTFSEIELSTIKDAFRTFAQKTCITFQPRTTQPDYVSINNANTGCWSFVGRVGGKQVLNLQTPRCLYTLGSPMHEMMHALGFLHEQNRYERDPYIEILTENIIPEIIWNFDKYPRSQAMTDVAYDYGSVMHYSLWAGTKNGEPTMAVKRSLPSGVTVGQRAGLSKKDIAKIRLMYKCNRRLSGIP